MACSAAKMLRALFASTFAVYGMCGPEQLLPILNRNSGECFAIDIKSALYLGFIPGGKAVAWLIACREDAKMCQRQ